MKLRISGDSLRLRLDANEVSALVEQGKVEESMVAAPGRSLVYALCIDDAATEMGVRFETREDDATITVVLPTETARPWAASEDEVSLRTRVEIGERSLKVLIEKDLGCSHRGATQSLATVVDARVGSSPRTNFGTSGRGTNKTVSESGSTLAGWR